MKASDKKSLRWGAFGFSVFLSCLPMIGLIVRTVRGGSSEWWQPAFYGFLPMCFFFIGTELNASRIEMQKLRDEVEALRSKLP